VEIHKARLLVGTDLADLEVKHSKRFSELRAGFSSEWVQELFEHAIRIEL
jgi:hypothetical protein